MLSENKNMYKYVQTNLVLIKREITILNSGFKLIHMICKLCKKET